MWDPAAFEGATHVSAPEREALARLEEWGLVDAFRRLYADDRLFTWWDYRAGNFHKHQGMRIDLVLVTESPGQIDDLCAHRPERPEGSRSRPTTARCSSTSTSPGRPDREGGVAAR